MHKIGKVYKPSLFCAYNITKIILFFYGSFIGNDMFGFTYTVL